MEIKNKDFLINQFEIEIELLKDVIETIKNDSCFETDDDLLELEIKLLKRIDELKSLWKKLPNKEIK